jgi:hypothetical protein
MKIDFEAIIDRMSDMDQDAQKAMLCAMKKIYKMAYARDPQEVDKTLDMIIMNNYLTLDEAKNIMADFVNYDGSKGAKWSCAEIEKFLAGKGIATEQSPYYNSYALAVAMNRIYSDYGGEIKDLTDDEAVACYSFALRDLKDPDRPRWIREYFEKSLKE